MKIIEVISNTVNGKEKKYMVENKDGSYTCVYAFIAHTREIMEVRFTPTFINDIKKHIKTHKPIKTEKVRFTNKINTVARTYII